MCWTWVPGCYVKFRCWPAGCLAPNRSKVQNKKNYSTHSSVKSIPDSTGFRLRLQNCCVHCGKCGPLYCDQIVGGNAVAGREVTRPCRVAPQSKHFHDVFSFEREGRSVCESSSVGEQFTVDHNRDSHDHCHKVTVTAASPPLKFLSY